MNTKEYTNPFVWHHVWKPLYVFSDRYPGWNLFSQSLQGTEYTSKKTVLLLLPLGQSSSDIYLPLIAYFGTSLYCYITWDYRGFYRSKNINGNVHCGSIHDHALDGVDILNAYNIDIVDIIIGHSMGATIAAQIAVHIPSRVGRIVLLNYSPGHVFKHAFSPVCPNMFIWREPCLRIVIRFFRTNPYIFRILCILYKLPLRIILLFLTRYVYYEKWLSSTVYLDPIYLCSMLDLYTKSICHSNTSVAQYFESFDQLDQHIVDETCITVPTLLIGGVWDIFTPVHVYHDSINNIQNVTYVCDIYSTHVTILENVHLACYHISKFIIS
jgi:pimeloyl-ACP methyl ester carboxylesterase